MMNMESEKRLIWRYFYYTYDTKIIGHDIKKRKCETIYVDRVYDEYDVELWLYTEWWKQNLITLRYSGGSCYRSLCPHDSYSWESKVRVHYNQHFDLDCNHHHNDKKTLL